MEILKPCLRCKRQLPVSYYGKNRYTSDHLKPWCKDCYRQYNNQRYVQGNERAARVFRTKEKRYKNRMKKLLGDFINSPVTNNDDKL